MTRLLLKLFVKDTDGVLTATKRQRYGRNAQNRGNQPPRDKPVHQFIGKFYIGKRRGQRRYIYGTQKGRKQNDENQRRDERHEKSLFVLEI